MRIFLLGFMGAGKTTIGKKLAKEYYFRFIDLDDYIERKQQKSIPDIFSQEGQDTFRLYERQALEDMTKEEDIVVATGGGAPCFFDNIELINENAISIYIRMSPGQIVNRLQNAKMQRPLVKDKSGKELYDFVSDTLAKREKFYSKANAIIDNDHISVKEAVKRIEGKIEEC